MYLKYIIIALFFSILSQFVAGQQASYSVRVTDFSSSEYDEFCPVYYNHGLVFCTNRAKSSISSYIDSKGQSQVKIYYIDTTSTKGRWKNSKLLTKSLTTKFNDGPVTFSRNRDTIYFSRNLLVNGGLDKISNSSSVYSQNCWSKIKELRFNSERYNITTPALSPDGKILFFASDMPGGYGGSDLYSCEWKGDYWDEPVNLGPEINTRGNEAYPFMNEQGELFFSSDSLPGIGGKDIFVTAYIDNKWVTPVHLDEPVNSKFDDFGIIADSTTTEGYFSSNRNGSLDIFHFRTRVPQVFFAPLQKENNYCFQFADSGSILADTLNLRYVWNFGGGEKAYGQVVRHCFKGPGNYSVRLDIVDKSTGNLFFSKLSYNLVLSDYIQPCISSPDFAVRGEPVIFDGAKSNLPGFVISDYTWDFGDGTRVQGEKASHVFKTNGDFRVRLGLTMRSLSNGDIHTTGISKKVLIFNSEQERDKYSSQLSGRKSVLTGVDKYENAIISGLFSAESEYKKDAVFEVELLNSNTRIGVLSSLFSSIPGAYRVMEKYDSKAAVYRYIIDEQLSLMLTYNSFHQAISSGFRSAHVITEQENDAASKELNSLKKIFGLSTDIYFDKNSRLTSEAFLVLDQVYKILSKYSTLKLEVDVHTDDTGLPADKLKLSQQYAQIIARYLLNKGLDHNRLVVNGFGGSAPVAANNTEKGRTLNRRVEFLIIK